MKIFSERDVLKIIADTCLKNENLSLYAGKGDNKQPLITKGLKIKHKPTGLVYTVIKFFEDEGDPKILCQRPGKKLLISKDAIKNYERQ